MFRGGKHIDDHLQEGDDGFASPEEAVKSCIDLVENNGYLRQVIRSYNDHFGSDDNLVDFDQTVPDRYRDAIFSAITGPSEWKE